MKLERIILIVALLAIVLAVPIATVLKDRTNQLKIEKSEKQNLQIEFKTVEEQLKQKEIEVQTKEQEKSDLQKQNGELKNQLEAKRKQREAARLAASRPRARGNCEAYRPLIAKYDWDVRVAVAIARAESGCNPNAANLKDNHKVCKGSFGLFQISCHSGKVYDPAKNVEIAYAKYKASGWRPWSVYKNGKYKAYL